MARKKEEVVMIKILRDFSGADSYYAGQIINESDPQYPFFEEQAKLAAQGHAKLKAPLAPGMDGGPLCKYATAKDIKVYEKQEAEEKKRQKDFKKSREKKNPDGSKKDEDKNPDDSKDADKGNEKKDGKDDIKK